jgi:ABC-type transport system involved in cytochrome bd biosynthesis fused ATPase/permease subunit
VRPLAAFLASAWFGAAIFFAAVVAPGAFAVLQSHELAGGLIVRVLPPLFYAGLVIGLVMAIFDTARRRWAGLTMAGASAVAQFVVARRIDQLRATVSGAVDALPSTDPRQAAFARLHGLSVALFGVAMIAALIYAIAAWRSYGQHSR